MALDNDIDSAEGLYKKPVAAEGVYYFFWPLRVGLGIAVQLKMEHFRSNPLVFP